VAETETHVAAHGWDQPVRVFALVRTAEALEADPDVADLLDAATVEEARSNPELLMVVIGRQIVQPLTALGAQTCAVLPAQRLEWEREHESVAQGQLQIQVGFADQEQVIGLLIVLGHLSLGGLGQVVELVEGDGAHALGVHLVELTGVVDLVSRLEVAVHLLGAVARSQER